MVVVNATSHHGSRVCDGDCDGHGGLGCSSGSGHDSSGGLCHRDLCCNGHLVVVDVIVVGMVFMVVVVVGDGHDNVMAVWS